MGDGERASLKFTFDPKLRLEFHGATITSDAGMLAARELDEALGLTERARDHLKESRTGRTCSTSWCPCFARPCTAPSRIHAVHAVHAVFILRAIYVTVSN